MGRSRPSTGATALAVMRLPDSVVMRHGAGAIAPRLALLLAGLLAGYLLQQAFHTRALLPPEVSAFVVARMNAVLVAAIGSGETTNRVLWGMNRLSLAMPGALLFGVLMGIALRWTAHKRLLLYSVLAWPVGTYAYSTFLLRVVKNMPEDAQVALWHFRGVAAADSFFIYSSFFITAYLAFVVAKRLRPR